MYHPAVIRGFKLFNIYWLTVFLLLKITVICSTSVLKPMKLQFLPNNGVYTILFRLIERDYESISVLETLLQDNLHQMIYTVHLTGLTLKTEITFYESISINFLLKVTNPLTHLTNRWKPFF